MKKKLRLCYIADAQSYHTQRMTQHFSREGHDVFLLSCLPFSDHLQEQNLSAFWLGHNFTDNKNKRRLKHPWLSHQFDRIAYLLGLFYGLRLGYKFPFSVRNKIPFLPERENQYIMNLERCADKARIIIERIRPDIIHGHFLTNHGFVAARTNFNPLVVTAWGSDVLVRPQEWFMMRMILRYVLKKANLITSDAESMTKVILKHDVNPDNLVTFFWGIDTDIFYPAKDVLKFNRKTVFSSRRLDPNYNIELILQAALYLKEKIPDIEVLIAGKGSQEESLLRLARELNLDSNVTFLGFLSTEELACRYREASIYLSVPYSDSTSVSLLEAMASGAFPIVSDLPANREWIDNGVNGFIVPTDDPKLLADRIVQAFENKDLRIMAAKRNIDIVRKKALWKESVKKLEHHYYQLIDS